MSKENYSLFRIKGVKILLIKILGFQAGDMAEHLPPKNV
jgi:hypothetical protein